MTNAHSQDRHITGQLGDTLWAGRGISLMDAKFDNCRWPIDRIGRDGNPRCCGRPVSGYACPYCTKHRALAYTGKPHSRPLNLKDREVPTIQVVEKAESPQSLIGGMHA